MSDSPSAAGAASANTSPPPLSDEALLARFQNARSRPRGSDTLGFQVVRVEQAKMEIEATCQGRPEFCNPAGLIQGGFLCAMLDETMSVSGMVASGMSVFLPTLEMKTTFLRPAYPGVLTCVGRVVRWGKSVAFLEGELYAASGKLLAKASSTAMPQPFKAATQRG